MINPNKITQEDIDKLRNYKGGFLRLSDMDEKKREEYIKDYNKRFPIKPTKEFDENGLRFPIEHLKSIGCNVVTFAIEFMVEYVDEVTKFCIDGNDKDFLEIARRNMKDDIDLDDIDITRFNATSIGNLAYIHMNCKDKEMVELSEKVLNSLFRKIRSISADHLESLMKQNNN